MSSTGGNLGQRLAVSLVGSAIALVMIVLGLWQMQVFEAQGNKDAQRRSTAAAVDLVPLIPPDGSVGDVYGRNVRVRGSFTDQSVRVTDPGPTDRVVSALALPDGRVVAVARGVIADGAPLPQLPAGDVELTGVFLPSEPAGSSGPATESLPTVRLAQLQQRWPQQLAPGFLTLNEPEARAEGLSPARVVLPTQDGKFRNFGYALQWWVFATFALVMTVIWVRTLKRRALAAQEAAAADLDAGRSA